MSDSLSLKRLPLVFQTSKTLLVFMPLSGNPNHLGSYAIHYMNHVAINSLADGVEGKLLF